MYFVVLHWVLHFYFMVVSCLFLLKSKFTTETLFYLMNRIGDFLSIFSRLSLTPYSFFFSLSIKSTACMYFCVYFRSWKTFNIRVTTPDRLYVLGSSCQCRVSTTFSSNPPQYLLHLRYDSLCDIKSPVTPRYPLKDPLIILLISTHIPCTETFLVYLV